MKKLSIALITVLFASSSVQMFGMKRKLKNDYENPSLTQRQADLLWDLHDGAERQIKNATEMLKDARTAYDKAVINNIINRNEKRKQACHDILFDSLNRSYTDKEINDRTNI